MPLAYSFLDVAALVLAMCLFAGAIKPFLLRIAAWTWFSYLVTLSLFACLSCIIALDAQNAAVGDEFKRNELQQALVLAKANVATWTNNVDKTEKHKSNFQAKLDDAVSQRDDLIKQISKLDSTTPPSQVIFERGLAIMPVWMDEDQFRLYARLAFGFAMIITPLLLTGVLANVLGDGTKPELKREPEYSPELWSERRMADLVQNRYSDQTKIVDLDYEKERRPDQTQKKTRKTGLDRQAAKEIEEYLINGDGKISENYVREKWGVGKGLVRSIYQKLEEAGHIENDGPNTKWRRVNG